MKFVLLFLLIPFTNPPIGYRQLTWGDYRGVVPAGVQHDAVTCTNIIVKSDTAYAVFLPERSWMRSNDAGLLRHEQLHFAITKHMAEFVAAAVKAGKRDFVPALIEAWRQREWQYDCETDHGQDTTAQKRWEELIRL